MVIAERSQVPFSRTLSAWAGILRAKSCDNVPTVLVGAAKRVVGASARMRVIVFVKIMVTDVEDVGLAVAE